MSKLVEAIEDAVTWVVETTWEAIVDVASFVWNDLAMPLLEEVFSWFGIDDETVVTVSKISSKVFDSNNDDVVKKAKSRAVLYWMKTDMSLWKHIQYEMGLTRGKVGSYFRYADNGHYVHGLPSMTIAGENKDEGQIKTSLDTDKSINSVITYTSSSYPTPEEYFMHALQSAPTNFKPGLNKLTYDDEWGNSWNDWKWVTISYDEIDDQYEITVSRNAERATFWLEAPTEVTEGGTVDVIIHSNRSVPAGESVTVNLTYGGSLPGTEFTAPSSVVMGSGLNKVTATISITEDAVSEGLQNIIPTIDSITNTGGAFEYVQVGNQNSEDISVYDNESLVLTMNSVFVAESETSVTIPVKLNQAAAGPFTVDYALPEGTAVAGVDYDDTGGTLSFDGTDGEVQNIVIPLTPDVVSGGREDFHINFLNCSDPAVDISRVATVTLVDSVATGPNPDVVTYFRTIIRTPYSDSRAMVVKYYLTGENPNDWYYWIYYYSSNLYPDINPDMAVITELDMLPVAIIRKDKVNVDSNEASEEYRTTKNLLNRTDIKIDDLIDGVNSNESVDQIDDVYVNFGISPADTGKEISKMLFLTFYEIIFVRGITSNSGKVTAMFKEQDVNNATVWTGHEYKSDLPGSIAAVGEYTHTVHHTEEYNSLTIRFQKTVVSYDEIIVENMQGLASIAYDGYHKVAFTTINQPEFTIPVSWYVYEKLSDAELMRVYQDIFRVDFYAIDVTHLEWYETEAFFDFIKFAMVVVAVVTTIATFGAAGSFWAGAWAVFQTWAINYLVMEIVVAIAEETGNAYLAAAVALAAAYILRDVSGLPQGSFLTAESMTQVITTFSAGLGTVYQNEFDAMNQDMEELLEEQKEKEEYYEENAIEGGGLDTSFYAALMSVDSRMYMARDAQYDFDAQLTGAYDRLITNYHDLLLDLGVV